MDDESEIQDVLRRLNDCWLEKRPADLNGVLHDDVTMVFPGFAGRISGKRALIDGFTDFCESAVVHSFSIDDEQIDVAGNTGTASFRFAMVYKREGKKYLSTGRDLWVLSKNEGQWKAVWRTMLDVTEEPVAE